VRVLIFAADRSRVGHRLIWPAEHLASEGHEVEVRYPGQGRGGPPAWERWDRVDVVVIQRPMPRRLLEAVDGFRRDGVAVVVELDDDLTSLSRRHVLWPSIQPKLSPSCNWQIQAEACRRADLITVSTPALARRFAGHGRVVVVPNHVPASYLDVERVDHDGVWVGWTGTIATHPDDLQVTRGGVARAVESTGAEFALIGAPAGVQSALGLRDEPWAVGFVPLPWYPVAMAQFDVGVVPLEPSAFNESKSYLKGLEFAALGVPFVASPTGPYRDLARHAGVLAGKPREWEREVRRLIQSAGLRAELAGRGREWARGETVEANAWRWWNAWSAACNVAAKRRRVSA
jgi:glycosyltransferase involved in cell wall biosynthesis